MKGFSRARIGALSAVVGSLFVGLGTLGTSAQAATNSLSSWSKQGVTGAGTWTVANDGLSVTGTSNGAPTFFISNLFKSSATFEVDITPQNSAENDWVGIVLGYTAPNSPSANNACANADCENDFLLIDWKQATDSSGEAGYTLQRVDGPFNIRDNSESLPCFGTHPNTPTCALLDDGRAPTFGFVQGTTQTLRITYTPGSVTVERVGTNTTVTVLEATGTFPTGYVGLYNYSQGPVTFAVQDLADPTASTSSSSSSSSTTPTSVATTVTTASGAATTLATRIVRTGPNDAGWELLLGAGLIVLGAVLTSARGKRPLGRHFS